MLYSEIIAVCSQIHTKHIKTLCGQNVVLFNVKLAVHKRRVQKKARTFAIKIVLLNLHHIKRSPVESSHLYWRYTVPSVSSIVGMLLGTHFL